jgi:hypothetical protein
MTQCHIPEEWCYRNETFCTGSWTEPISVMQHIFVSTVGSLSVIFYNASIRTKNGCQCTINDYHIFYLFLVFLQKLFKQNGLTHVLRRVEVWMRHSIMCTLPTLFIFVARYLCQYSDWAMCWLTAEMGFSFWWRKDFSCQHCVQPAFCQAYQGLLFSFGVKAVLVFFNVAPCMLPHLLYNPTHALFTL